MKEDSTEDLMTLIPKNPSMRLPRQRRTVRAKKPSEKIEPRLTTSKDFVRYFHRQLRDALPLRHPALLKIVISGSELTSATELFDVLRDFHCLNEITIKAWVAWFIKEKVIDRPFVEVRVRGLKDSWAVFRHLRPVVNVKPLVPAHKEEIKPKARTVLDELQTILGTDIAKVGDALLMFGICLPANYLLRHYSEVQIDQAIQKFLQDELGSSIGRENIRLIYQATARHQTQAILHGNMPFSNWHSRYKKFWESARCKPCGTNEFCVSRAEQFFALYNQSAKL